MVINFRNNNFEAIPKSGLFVVFPIQQFLLLKEQSIDIFARRLGPIYRIGNFGRREPNSIFRFRFRCFYHAINGRVQS